MIVEALSWYVESISAFWVSLASGGLVKLILIWCFIYWICCRRRCHRWYRHCCGWHGGHSGCAGQGGSAGHGGHSANCECCCGGCACGVGDAGDDPEEAGEAETAV